MNKARKMRTIISLIAGLATALLIINLTTFPVIIGYGATVDDLRNYLGLAVDEPENPRDKVYEVEIDGKPVSSENSDTSDGTSSNNQSEINLAKLEGRFKQSINNESPAKVLVNLVNNIIDIKEDIAKAEKDSYYQDLIGNNHVIEDSFSVEEPEEDITSGKSMIGDIGSNAVSVVDKYKILVTPWGYTLDSSGNLSDKLLGIDLYTQVGDNICSQWHGVVEQITDDNSGGKTITIYHGNRLYTQYSHIQPLSDITPGQEVVQGQFIGTAIDTTSKEHTKDNHILYQINIDGEYINPLLIYGDTGKKMYDKWYKSSPNTNLIEEDEEYFRTEPDFSMNDTDKYIQNDADIVLYPDFNLDN